MRAERRTAWMPVILPSFHALAARELQGVGSWKESARPFRMIQAVGNKTAAHSLQYRRTAGPEARFDDAVKGADRR